MWTKILAIYYKIKYKLSKDYCYTEMEKRGYACFGKCCGLSGGDRYTEYLNYSCVDCPYLDLSGIGD